MRKMSAELDIVLSDIVKIVSYVKANVLNSTTLFSLLRDDCKDKKAVFISNCFCMPS